MAASLTGLAIKLQVGMQGTVYKTRDHEAIDGAEFQFSKNKNVTFSFGTGTGKGNAFFNDERELGASANETLDLAGSLTDCFGDTVTFSKIRAILITNDSDERDTPTTAILHVGGAAANQFLPFADASDEVIVPSGGAMLLLANNAAGYTCTGGASDNLKIEEVNAESATYSILVIGESA